MLVRGRMKWHESADVVVVGYGAAGGVAAITASEAGAKALILEKQPESSHISTSHLSGGVFVSPTDASAAARYVESLCKVTEDMFWSGKGMVRVWADCAVQTRDWVEKHGGANNIEHIRTGGEHKLPGHESIEAYFFKGRGPAFMRWLKQQVALTTTRVMYETRAGAVLTNLAGEVIGVKASRGGKDINVRALRTVVMAPGGFEFNEEMKLNYLKVYPAYFAASPASTGDGVRMAQEVGASLWHMNCCSASWVLKFPEFHVALGPNFRGIRGFTQWSRGAEEGTPYGYVIVDKYGRRYTNEEFKRHSLYYELAYFDSQRVDYPRIPSYWIFDRTRLEAGPLPLMFYGPMVYKWSDNNQEEIKKGWIVQGKDAGELAARMSMDPAILKGTVERYNEYAQQKNDREFHRPPQHLVPLDQPPFFAIRLWPGGANTQGGARHNERQQILSASGKPIPRLYGAGEFGSVYGMLYPAGGANLTECIALGRLAGQNAAGETPVAES
ncbi:MAG: FAD-binding protein [Chloroflexi bacterium]|nr:FAD-binding protein [Chloroflexota bacterium]